MVNSNAKKGLKDQAIEWYESFVLYYEKTNSRDSKDGWFSIELNVESNKKCQAIGSK